MPDNAPTGFNVGGLTAWVPAGADESTTTSEGFSAQVIIQTRRVLAVQVNVPGDAEPVLQISGVTATPRPSGMELDIAIANTGHGLASGNGTIKVSDGGFQKDFELGDVVPGTSMAYPITWPTDPEKKTYDATVSIQYNGKTVDWSGSFKVGQDSLTQLNNVQTTTTDGQNAGKKSGAVDRRYHWNHSRRPGMVGPGSSVRIAADGPRPSGAVPYGSAPAQHARPPALRGAVSRLGRLPAICCHPGVETQG